MPVFFQQNLERNGKVRVVFEILLRHIDLICRWNWTVEIATHHKHVWLKLDNFFQNIFVPCGWFGYHTHLTHANDCDDGQLKLKIVSLLNWLRSDILQHSFMILFSFRWIYLVEALQNSVSFREILQHTSNSGTYRNEIICSAVHFNKYINRLYTGQ